MNHKHNADYHIFLNWCIIDVVLNESGTKSLCGQAVWLLVDGLLIISDSMFILICVIS